MASPIIPIVLAGGAGTRLWPVSRDALPKQFLPLIGNRSTYQETLLRVQDVMFAPHIVITGPNFHFFARRQAEEIGIDATIIIEPMRRDSRQTGPPALGVLRICRPDDVALIETAMPIKRGAKISNPEPAPSTSMIRFVRSSTFDDHFPGSGREFISGARDRLDRRDHIWGLQFFRGVDRILRDTMSSR